MTVNGVLEQIEQACPDIIDQVKKSIDMVEGSFGSMKLEIWKKDATLKIKDDAVVSTVTKSKTYQNSMTSIIEQTVDSIRLKAIRISWERITKKFPIRKPMCAFNKNQMSRKH